MNQKLTMVVLAAGMGSRYGGLKQMDGFGPNGEAIMDYSIYDAIQAGFNKIVFVVRSTFHDAIKTQFSNKYGHLCELHFVNQEITDTPISIDYGRKKPWGTGHALWVTRHVVNEAFGVINADDFYGREAFFKLASFLQNNPNGDYGMISYLLENTLSDFGSVNRGVCTIDVSTDRVMQIKECLKIRRLNQDIASYLDNDTEKYLSIQSKVSMNMFGFTPSYFKYFEEMFIEFLNKQIQESECEFYIPLLIDKIIKDRTLNVHSFTAHDKWFGVTYPEDKMYVEVSLKLLHKLHVYPDHLYMKLLQNVS